MTFTPSKTKKAVTVPLHAELERDLLKSPGVGKAFLFPSLAGIDTGGKRGLSGKFAEIMGRAGIEGKITRHTEKGRANCSLSFHSPAQLQLGNGKRRRFTGNQDELTGHSSTKMNRGYTHHELEPLRAAVAAISGLGGRAAK